MVKQYFELFCGIVWHVSLICRNPKTGYALKFRLQLLQLLCFSSLSNTTFIVAATGVIVD